MIQGHDSKCFERETVQQHVNWNICVGGFKSKKSIRPTNQPLDTKEQLLHAFRHYVIDDQMEEKLAEFLKKQ